MDGSGIRMGRGWQMVLQKSMLPSWGRVGRIQVKLLCVIRKQVYFCHGYHGWMDRKKGGKKVVLTTLAWTVV